MAILSSYNISGLTYAQRVEYFRLLHSGVPAIQAREMAVAVEKAQAKPATGGPDFHKAFLQAAKAQLPKWQFDHLHHQARSRAGGIASGRTRQRALGDADLGISVDGGPGVPAPATPPDTPAQKAAHSPVAKRAVPSATGAQALAAQRLVAGMDTLTARGADVASARVLASQALTEKPGQFDTVHRPAWAHGDGLMFDVGSGPNRLPGFLGLDTYPADYGTVLCDPSMGLPFDNGAACAVRLGPGFADAADPTACLQACLSALSEGGALAADLPKPLAEYVDSQAMGRLVAAQAPDGGQLFTKRTPPIPAVYGADVQPLPAEPDPDATTDDLELAAAAMGAQAHAEAMMANLIHKSVPAMVTPVNDPKTGQPWERYVLSVVYAPGELDTDEEYMTPEDIEAAAHGAMLNGAYIGSEHGGEPMGVSIVESYIARTPMRLETPYGPQFVPEGSWLMGLKFTDAAEWQKVLDGTYQGLSLGGFALRDAA